MKTESLKRQRVGAEGKPSAIRADQRVVLKNGQSGTVQFVSATMKVARVRMADGRVRTVKLAEIAPAAPSRDEDGNPQRRQVRLRMEEPDPDHPIEGEADIDPEEGFAEQDEFETEDEDGRRELLQHLLRLGPKNSGTSDDVEHVSSDEDADDPESETGGDDEEGEGGSDDESGEEQKSEVRRTLERAHPVRGQRPMVSDRVARRAETGIAGPPTKVRREDIEKVGRKDPESGRQVVQPSGSIRQNERLAAEAAPELETRLSRAAARVPGAKFVRLRPQKNPERLRNKIKSEEKPAETISDYLASQISADSVEAKDRMIAELKKRFKVVNVEDKFLQGRKEKAGYPSANVQVGLSNGGTAEVQIVPREVQQATEQSHHFYKMGRNAKDAGKTALAKHYFDQATAINERALARFRMRNA